MWGVQLLWWRSEKYSITKQGYVDIVKKPWKPGKGEEIHGSKIKTLALLIKGVIHHIWKASELPTGK